MFSFGAPSFWMICSIPSSMALFLCWEHLFLEGKNQLNPEHASTVQLYGLPSLGGFCAKGTLGRLIFCVCLSVCPLQFSNVVVDVYRWRHRFYPVVRWLGWFVGLYAQLVRWLVFVIRRRLCLTSLLLLRGRKLPEGFVGFLTMLYPCCIG